MKEILKIGVNNQYSIAISEHETKQYITVTSYHDKNEVANNIIKKVKNLIGDLPVRELDDIDDNYELTARLKVNDVVFVDNTYITPLDIMMQPPNTKLYIWHLNSSSNFANNINKRLKQFPIIKDENLNYGGTIFKIDKRIRPYNIFHNNVHIQYESIRHTLSREINIIKEAIIKEKMSDLTNNLSKSRDDYSIHIDNLNVNKVKYELSDRVEPHIQILRGVLLRFGTKLVFSSDPIYGFPRHVYNRTKFFVYLLPFLGYENIKLVLQAVENACAEIGNTLFIPTKEILKEYEPYLSVILNNMNKDYFIDKSEEFKFKNANEVTEFIVRDLQN